MLDYNMQRNSVLDLEIDEGQVIAEIIRNLPDDYKKTLYGAALGLLMAAETEPCTTNA